MELSPELWFWNPPSCPAWSPFGASQEMLGCHSKVKGFAALDISTYLVAVLEGNLKSEGVVGYALYGQYGNGGLG